jgi:hypothetical protein
MSRTPTTPTVIFGDREPVSADVRSDGERLWLSAGDLERATGWTLKPEGLCQDDACVPLPADGSWIDAEGRIDVAAFARRLRRPAVHDEEHAVWAFGAPAEVEAAVAGAAPGTGPVQAPDFTLPDLDGERHSLSDFRGRKILLLAWGSY